MKKKTIQLTVVFTAEIPASIPVDPDNFYVNINGPVDVWDHDGNCITAIQEYETLITEEI